MKIVLINPPLKSKQRLYKELAEVKVNYPPLGLCYLGAVLREKGYQVKILDLQIEKEHVKSVLLENPDFIGITATTVAIKNAAQLAKQLKKKTKALIILGGPHITAVPIKTMKLFPQFDVGIVGEGERTMVELLNCMAKLPNTQPFNHRTIESLKNIPGLVFRQPPQPEAGPPLAETANRQPSTANRQPTTILTPPRPPILNLDSLPLPAFDLLPDFSHYGGSQFIEFDERATFRLVTSRGCPFHCRFCDKSIFGKMFRANSPAYVMRMVKTLYHHYNIRHIYFSDDTFTLNKKRVFEICQLLQKEGLDLTWDCNSRVDTVNLSLLKAMKKAGCTYIAYGIESGSQKILKILGKGITLNQIRKTCQDTVKANIKIRGNFIMGNPGETKETIKQTNKFAKSLPLYTFKMSFFTPFPNTELYNEIDKWGKYKEDWSKLSKYSPVFVPRHLTKEELEKYYKSLYFSFYFRPKIVVQYLKGLKNLTALKYASKNFIILSRFLLTKKFKQFQPIITLIVSLLILTLLFAKIKLGETITAISFVDLKPFFLACFLSLTTNFLGITDKWRRILKELGYDISYQELLFPRIGSYAIRGILPLKSGELTRVAYLKKFHQVPLKTGVASAAIGLFLNIISLLPFIALGWLLTRN